MIKPEFWSSEDIIELEYTERLFYIGFWNFADDSGVLPDKPKSLKCNIFPADNVECKPIIDKLVKCGLLVRYTVGTDSYLRVAQWDKHQTIKHPTFKYPLETTEIPVHVRYKGGTCTEGVLPKEKEKEKEKLIEIEQRKTEFRELTRNKWIELGEAKYLDEAEIFNFFNYWTEHGDNDRLMRFEKEKSFGVGRRLGTWRKNNQSSSNPNVRVNA